MQNWQIILIIIFSSTIATSLVLALIAKLSNFTEVATGTVQLVQHGKEYIKTIEDKLGFFVWGWFGKHRIGFKFLNWTIKDFFINTDEMNPNANAKDPSTWLIRKANPKKVNFLLKKIPRFIFADDLELGGLASLQVTAGFAINLWVIDAKKFVCDWQADFTNPVDFILTEIRFRISQFEKYEDLNEAPAHFLDEMLGDTYLQESLAEYGLTLKKIRMPFLATDKSLEIAGRLNEIAVREAMAQKTKADANAYVTVKEGTAVATVMEAQAGAKIRGRRKSLKKGTTAQDEKDILIAGTYGDAIENSKLTHLTVVSPDGKVAPVIDVNKQD